MKNVQEMSTKEILDEYNSLTGKSIKRFASRAAAEKQLTAARAGGGKKKEKTAKPAKEKKAKTPKAPKSDKLDRAAAVRESWNDRATAAARSARSGVKVGNTTYKSVRAAFEELKLPIGRHIRFRGELKKAGQLAFDHDGKKINFTVVEAAAE